MLRLVSQRALHGDIIGGTRASMGQNSLNRFMRRAAAMAPVILISELALGCAGSTRNQAAYTPVEQRAYIARTCAALKKQAPGAVPVGILLEVADVVEPIGAPIKDWLSIHPVQVHHVAQILVPIAESTPVHGPFGTCLEPNCLKAEDATLEVIVMHPPTAASAPVELQLNLTSGDRQPRGILVKTTDQEPILASLSTAPKQTIIVTPYYLFESSKRGLTLLLQCAGQTPKIGSK